MGVGLRVGARPRLRTHTAWKRQHGWRGPQSVQCRDKALGGDAEVELRPSAGGGGLGGQGIWPRSSAGSWGPEWAGEMLA